MQNRDGLKTKNLEKTPREAIYLVAHFVATKLGTRELSTRTVFNDFFWNAASRHLARLGPIEQRNRKAHTKLNNNERERKRKKKRTLLLFEFSIRLVLRALFSPSSFEFFFGELAEQEKHTISFSQDPFISLNTFQCVVRAAAPI